SFFVTISSSTTIYHLSLHDALPIFQRELSTNHAAHLACLAKDIMFAHFFEPCRRICSSNRLLDNIDKHHRNYSIVVNQSAFGDRSEEHTSELQSREKLVCRLLLEKK